ncbi:kinase-like domain-containing protein [Thelephora terrestris]|uniref:Kinase-like domain-containing protein n=1 Tax=Thelephora terrestris TaxID=56493 RepID=A0A9P6HF48_9AGAM|nr:kinase-like domain-containing protein [Thelephora terrestris]
MDRVDPEKSFKRLCREVVVWKHLSHPNILPLLGVSFPANPHRFRVLTEWMPNGNIMQYAKSNRTANRLQLLSEVMSGVTYFHDLGIVHADIKGANILVDDMGVARVADFGLMTITDLTATFLSEPGDSGGGTWSRMSPELLNPKDFGSDGRPTRESDCYALGMLIYEFLTGLRPFPHVQAPPLILAILDGVRPEKPPHAESFGFSDTLWGLLQSCWSERSSTRPTAGELLDHIVSISPSWIPPTVYPAVMTDIAASNLPNSLSATLSHLT